MAWVTLVIAGFCEVLGVMSMGLINRKKNLASYAMFVAAFGTSFSLLSYSMQHISMGTAYAIWTGIGTAGGAIAAMIFFGESKEWKRFVFIGMIITAAVGLKLIA
jgi:paired small multidrug resistance pump